MQNAMTFVVALMIAVLTSIAAAEEVKPVRVPDDWKFSLPAGDAGDGKVAFMRMRCFTCHVVRIPGEQTPTVGTAPGPVLSGGYAKLPAEYVAEAIMRAHTTVAAPGYELRKDIAGMGNYNYFLTIQELVDIVAFMKTLADDEKK